MNLGFWDNLEKPIMALAPMHDVTDTVFRQMVAQKGKPDVMFTEFVSVDGLMHEYSREKMIAKYLPFVENERPLVAQIWGTDPQKFYEAAQLVAKLGFDGVDINMGCPEKSAVKHGACSALIQTPELAQDIIRATQEGAGSLPVSVKTRIGFGTNIVEEWVSAILETKPAVLTMHGRTAKQMSKVPADWDSIAKTVELAKETGTLVLGNGDVRSLEEAHTKVVQYGVDGVMIGRGIFSNHWLFNKERTSEPNMHERLQALIDHAQLYEETFKGTRNFSALRKHFRAYTNVIPGGKQLRIALMHAHTTQKIKEIINTWLKEREYQPL